MASDVVAIILVILFAMVVISAIWSVLVFCYERCCHDDGYKYKALPYEDVESVSLNDKQWTTNNGWKQPNDNEAIIDLSDEIKKTVSCSVCKSCSKKFETFNIESSFCPKCRYRLYSSICLSDEVKSEVIVEYSEASLDRDAYFKCNQIVKTTLKTLLEHPSNRGLFSKMPDREGSTKVGLKTRIPAEFDFSVTILMQDAPTFVPRADIENENKHSKWGDCQDADKKKSSIGCTVIKLGPRDERRFKECCVQGELSPTKLRLYFKTFLSTAIQQSKINGVEVKVLTEMNGPAVRLELQAKDLGVTHRIDIDVTPKVVLSYDISPKRFARGFEWPRDSTYQFLSENELNCVQEQDLYFVPKSGRYWCLSFANYENEILKIFHNSSVEKKIIRCMKVKLEAWQTQSRGKLNEISSYLLKGDCQDADKKKSSIGCTVIKLGPRDERRFKECCVQGELSPTKLRLYFKTFLSTAIQQSKINGVEVKVLTEMNGPAVRLELQAKDLGVTHRIDIDVTPKVVLSYDISPKRFARGFEWPRDSTYQFLSENELNCVQEQDLYFVPKSGRYWCLSFANYENEILKIFHNSSVEKKIIRCMKVKLEAWQTQSRGKLNEISSYLLKEVFFWLRENMPYDSLWTSDQCAERYYNFVEELRFYFEKGHLPSYFVPKINLLKGKEKSRALMIQYLDEELKKIC